MTILIINYFITNTESFQEGYLRGPNSPAMPPLLMTIPLMAFVVLPYKLSYPLRPLGATRGNPEGNALAARLLPPPKVNWLTFEPNSCLRQAGPLADRIAFTPPWAGESFFPNQGRAWRWCVRWFVDISFLASILKICAIHWATKGYFWNIIQSRSNLHRLNSNPVHISNIRRWRIINSDFGIIACDILLDIKHFIR